MSKLKNDWCYFHFCTQFEWIERWTFTHTQTGDYKLFMKGLLFFALHWPAASLISAVLVTQDYYSVSVYTAAVHPIALCSHACLYKVIQRAVRTQWNITIEGQLEGWANDGCVGGSATVSQSAQSIFHKLWLAFSGERSVCCHPEYSGVYFGGRGKQEKHTNSHKRARGHSCFTRTNQKNGFFKKTKTK